MDAHSLEAVLRLGSGRSSSLERPLVDALSKQFYDLIQVELGISFSLDRNARLAPLNSFNALNPINSACLRFYAQWDNNAYPR